MADTSKIVRIKPNRKKPKMNNGSGAAVRIGLRSATTGRVMTAVSLGVSLSVILPASGSARKVPTGALSSAIPSTALSMPIDS